MSRPYISHISATYQLYISAIYQHWMQMCQFSWIAPRLEFGSCTGITGGGRWLQLGDWRIAGVDNAHFSISHRGGQTAQRLGGNIRNATVSKNI